MTENILLPIILLPAFLGALLFLLPLRASRVAFFLSALFNAILTFSIFGQQVSYAVPWAGFGLDFSLRLYQFSGFILAACAFFGLSIAVYSLKFMSDKQNQKQFYACLLLSLSFVNGAVLADNLALLLFFWEALLVTMFFMINIGSDRAYPTAKKAFIIVGFSDICLMAGVILSGILGGTLNISGMHLSCGGLSSAAFILLIVGALAKAGSMPFHTWIPNAAVDSPLPFMAFFPAAIEKVLGIYLLSRICLDIFKLEASSAMSTLLMAIGALTIILAVMMALIQKDYKRLLSYHAISQVGYMVLGIGTCLPVGIVGGIFHMINNALYKSCLFLTAGSVEKQAGTTELSVLGGLWRKMPVTFICFTVAALSISGVFPFNGFFSKELIYDAVLERGVIFYIAAVLGSFFTAVSFLKLGHAVFIGRSRRDYPQLKEASYFMLLPMIMVALICILFGVFNYLPLRHLIQPIIADRLMGHDYSGMPHNIVIVAISLIALLGAFMHHIFAVRIMGSALKAADDIYHAPIIRRVYDWAERGFFDPYIIGMKLVGKLSVFLMSLDRLIDWFLADFCVSFSNKVSLFIRQLHSGYYVIYIIWSLIGAVFVAVLAIR